MHTRLSRIRALLGILLFAGLFVAGCGLPSDDGGGGTDCAFGTWDSASSSCVNEPTCKQPDDCIPGFECADDGVCEATTKCMSDGDCEVGVCESGACVNPESCTKNEECLPRTYCDTSDGEGSCEPDPCNDVRCPRGVCKRGTDKCVSKESCTKENELRDCVSGEKCLDGTCVKNEKFCEQLTCERGVCSLQESSCVNADECEGDEQCVSGYFCNDSNLCQRDLCERDGIDCGPRGVCQPKSGKCENATDCSSNADCLRDHLCVEGTCRHETTACGDAGGDGGCPGNQECAYDSEKLTVTCKEPEICATTLDCKGDRRCNGRNCVQPESCREDRFEPNDGASEATSFTENDRNGSLWASICSGDTDVFTVETTDIVGRTTRGQMVVEVNVPPRDRGLGELQMKLTGPNGKVHGDVSTGAMGADGRARIQKRIFIHEHGTYTVEISSGGKLSQAGVGYRLSADILPKETLKACRNADPITVNQRVSGTTVGATSTELGSTCTEKRNPAQERVYELQVDRPQELQIELTPESGNTNLSMSLRRHCLQRASELACAEEGGQGDKETITKLVSPGTYFMIIQSADGATGGDYRLKVESVFTTCAADGSFCNADGDARVCEPDGSGFRTVACQSGCDRSRGRCVPPDGDICPTATKIDPMNTQTRTVNLEQASDRYQVGGGSCIGFGQTQTNGPEVAYEVDVPARKSVRAEATFANDIEGALYLVEDCESVDSTCVAGVQNSTSDDDREVLQYSNESQQDDETLFLIVDTADPKGVRTAELDITYEDVVCSPGSIQCQSGDVYSCNQYGTNFSKSQTCGLQCKNGTCQGDDCSSAVNITSAANQSGGVTYSNVDWSGFSDDYSSSPCSSASISSIDTGGTDSFYQVDLNSNDQLTASASGSGDMSLWIWDGSSCGSTSTSCLDSDEDEGGSVSVSYTAGSQQTVYMVLDRESGSSGTFTLDADVQ